MRSERQNDVNLTRTGVETVELLEALLAHESGDPSEAERLVTLTLRDRLSRNLLRLKGPEGRRQVHKRWEVFRRTFPTWFKRVVSVAGLPVEVELSSGQFWLVYMVLGEYLMMRAKSQGGRLLVGVTGPPGCGKSTLSAILASIVGDISGPDANSATVCPMDGFHYTNDYLSEAQVELPDGREVSLMARKGAPETFDTRAAIRKVRQLRDGGQEVKLPEYSRLKHGPVRDAIVVPAGDHVALVEGNYLLLRDAGWQGMSDLLDLVLFIECDRDEQEAALVRRHVRGGKSRKAALRQVREVDLRNAVLVEQQKSRADIVLLMSPEYQIEKVTLTKRLRNKVGCPGC